MKPLIRQFIYDRLRKSLYKHEIKRLVWNNPYYPFYTKEDYNSILKNIPLDTVKFGCDSEQLDIILKGCREYLKKKNIKTLEMYNAFLDMIVESGDGRGSVIFLLHKLIIFDNIYQDIEDKYGKCSIHSNKYRNDK